MSISEFTYKDGTIVKQVGSTYPDIPLYHVMFVKKVPDKVKRKFNLRSCRKEGMMRITSRDIVKDIKDIYKEIDSYYKKTL